MSGDQYGARSVLIRFNAMPGLFCQWVSKESAIRQWKVLFPLPFPDYPKWSAEISLMVHNSKIPVKRNTCVAKSRVNPKNSKPSMYNESRPWSKRPLAFKSAKMTPIPTRGRWRRTLSVSDFLWIKSSNIGSDIYLRAVTVVFYAYNIFLSN